jgi:hypothetical protein
MKYLSKQDKEKEIVSLKRRLANHKRRLNRWSGAPSFSQNRPRGKDSLQSSYMNYKYEVAVCDARSIAQLLDSLGCEVEVVDVRETFRARWFNPNAPKILIWPKEKRS